MPSDQGEYDRDSFRSEYAVAFLSARELRILDADPVLDRADYWEGGIR